MGTLSQRITNQVHGLKGLNSKLVDIRSYLERVTAGKLPINHQIIYQLQDVFNLLPDVNLLVSCRLLWLDLCHSARMLFTWRHILNFSSCRHIQSEAPFNHLLSRENKDEQTRSTNSEYTEWQDLILSTRGQTDPLFLRLEDDVHPVVLMQSVSI